MQYSWLVPILLVSACATVPNYQFISGGDTVNQPGVSFVLPKEKSWVALIRSTYEVAFVADKMPKNDTLAAAVRIYNAPPSSSEEEFLEAIKKLRSPELRTDRFERISNEESLYQARTETCVVHKSKSKDLGVEAKRGGDYSVFETFGMNCIHPIKNQVVVLVELSRKAPPNKRFAEFESMAHLLLKSVEFNEF